MRSFTKLLLFSLTVIFANSVYAQCDPSVFTYYGHTNASWEPSEYYQIIDMDAATLTDPTLYPRTGAEDGTFDNSNYGQGTVKAPVGSGEIVTPLYDYDEGSDSYIPSGKTYSIKYWNCVFAPDHYGSAYTKLNEYGTEPSGKDNGCTKNDNTVLVGNVFNKKGFIELSRQSSTEAEGSKHGGIQLDGLRGIEKIQWSYSSTSWKRGVMCEVKWGDGDWQIRRSIPSGVGGGGASAVDGYATFSEQGYEFEEVFNLGEDFDREFSIRFRIWDGDTITWKDAYDNGEKPAGYFYTKVDPYGEPQVVRIHQIKVFSGMQGSDFANYTNISNNQADNFSISKIGNAISLSEEGNVEIYTIDGKLVKTVTGKEINISDLNKGIYVVKAKSLSGIVKNTKIAL